MGAASSNFWVFNRAESSFPHFFQWLAFGVFPLGWFSPAPLVIFCWTMSFAGCTTLGKCLFSLETLLLKIGIFGVQLTTIIGGNLRVFLLCPAHLCT